MKLIISGSRDCVVHDYDWFINGWLCEFTKPTEIVSGHARGPDKEGERWAKENDVPVKLFIPEWQKNGKFIKSAGIQRNKQMADYADALLCFWNGKSPGTWNMILEMYDREKPFNAFLEDGYEPSQFTAQILNAGIDWWKPFAREIEYRE